MVSSFPETQMEGMRDVHFRRVAGRRVCNIIALWANYTWRATGPLKTQINRDVMQIGPHTQILKKKIHMNIHAPTQFISISNFLNLIHSSQIELFFFLKYYVKHIELVIS